LIRIAISISLDDCPKTQKENTLSTVINQQFVIEPQLIKLKMFVLTLEYWRKKINIYIMVL